MRSRIIYGNPIRYFVDDREVTEAEYRAASPSRLKDLLRAGTTATSHSPDGWPLVSEALAVHPKQVKQANERARQHGVNVEYEPSGRVRIPDRGARNALLALEGMYDADACYGDRTPGHGSPSPDAM